MLISISVSVISVVIIGMKYNARKKVLISDTRYLAYPHPIPHTPHIHLIPTPHRPQTAGASDTLPSGAAGPG